MIGMSAAAEIAQPSENGPSGRALLACWVFLCLLVAGALAARIVLLPAEWPANPARPAMLRRLLDPAAQRQARVYHLRDTHWNSRGHRTAGLAIADRVLQDRFAASPRAGPK